MTTTALHCSIFIGEPFRGCFEMAGGAVCMVGLGYRTGSMAAKTGMIFNFQEFVVLHHILIVIVIMTLGTVDSSAFAILDGWMTGPARNRLVILSHLLVAVRTIPAMKFL